MRATLDTSIVIQRFKDKHGDRYDYSKSIYKSYYDKVEIICEKHGSFFQTAHHHYEGRGCPNCAKSGVKLKRDRVISDFIKIHGDEFLYDDFKYVNDYTKSKITCRTHGEFRITPNSHKNGTKCPYCFMERCGFGKSRFIKCSEEFGNKATLYLVKLSNDSECFYKIGITTNMEKRFTRGKTPYDIEIVKLVEGDSSVIWESEKEIHRKLFDFRYTPKNKFDGSTESFSIESINTAIEVMSMFNCKEIKAGHRL